MPLLSEKTFEKKQTFDFPTPWAMNLWGVEFFSCTMKTPKQTYCSRNLQEKAKIIEEHLKGVSKAKLMEKYEIPISTLNRILQSQESILKIVDSQASLKIPKSACISQLRLYQFRGGVIPNQKRCYRDLAKEIKKTLQIVIMIWQWNKLTKPPIIIVVVVLKIEGSTEMPALRFPTLKYSCTKLCQHSSVHTLKDVSTKVFTH